MRYLAPNDFNANVAFGFFIGLVYWEVFIGGIVLQLYNQVSDKFGVWLLLWLTLGLLIIFSSLFYFEITLLVILGVVYLLSIFSLNLFVFDTEKKEPIIGLTTNEELAPWEQIRVVYVKKEEI